MKRSVGVYSGTFDPIHPGHKAFALEVMRACKLREVIFLPEHNPRGKTGVTALSHRIALIKHETANYPYLRVATLASKQFTVNDTLPELRTLFGDAHLTLLVGSDVVRTFAYRWEGLGVLLRELSVAIGMRAGDSQQEIVGIIERLQKAYSTPIRYTLIYTDNASMASSEIRKNMENLAQLQPATRMYIKRHDLYRAVGTKFA